MGDQPNLSRGGMQELEFVGRRGDQCVYKGENQKMALLDVGSVKHLGMPSTHSRKRKHQGKYTKEDVWSGSRSSQTQDKQATAKLLEIMKSYQVQQMFSNRRMRKREVWMEVTKELMAAGFHFRNKENAWEKVSQKWRNMERTYRLHLNSIRGKRSTVCRSMEFFDQLHELLADKYSTGSVLQDHEIPDTSYHSQNECEESQTEMPNGEFEYEEEEEQSYQQPEIENELGQELLQADVCYDTYVEDEFPPSPTFSDNKNLVFASGLQSDPHTAEVGDPVIRLLLEMRAQERAHFREDRRERLKMQREAQDFRRDLVSMLNQQHQEKMEVMHNLVATLSGAFGGSVGNSKLNHTPNSEKQNGLN